MINGQRIVAMIPARMGSQRLKKKNLILLDGKPLVQYAIEAAKNSGVFDEIILNTDGEDLKEIAEDQDITFYLRDPALAQSEIQSDDVVHNFMNEYPADITAWMNTTSPLQTGDEVKGFIENFTNEQLDSSMTVYTESVHCLKDGEPCNFDPNTQFARTQDLPVIDRMVYSVMAWRNSSFQADYQSKGYAFFCGKSGFYPVSKPTSLIVKTEQDLLLCEQILLGRKSQGPLSYYKDKS